MFLRSVKGLCNSQNLDIHLEIRISFDFPTFSISYCKFFRFLALYFSELLVCTNLGLVLFSFCCWDSAVCNFFLFISIWGYVFLLGFCFGIFPNRFLGFCLEGRRKFQFRLLKWTVILNVEVKFGG